MQERIKEMQSELQTVRESHETNVELIKSETSKLQDEMAKIQQHLEEQLREAQYRSVGFGSLYFTVTRSSACLSVIAFCP